MDIYKLIGQNPENGREKTVYFTENSGYAYEPYNEKFRIVHTMAGSILVTDTLEDLLHLKPVRTLKEDGK